jgi:hypothetical protein
VAVIDSYEIEHLNLPNMSRYAVNKMQFQSVHLAGKNEIIKSILNSSLIVSPADHKFTRSYSLFRW